MAFFRILLGFLSELKIRCLWNIIGQDREVEWKYICGALLRVRSCNITLLPSGYGGFMGYETFVQRQPRQGLNLSLHGRMGCGSMLVDKVYR